MAEKSFEINSYEYDGKEQTVIDFKDGKRLTLPQIEKMFGEYGTATEPLLGRSTGKRILKFLKENNPTKEEFIKHFTSIELNEGGDVFDQTEQAMYLSDSFDFASADPKTKRNLLKNLKDDQFKDAFNLKLDKQADASYAADKNIFRKKAFEMGKALGFDSRNAQLLSSTVDYLPFIGTPSGVNDVFTDLKNKHYVGATINALATAASVLPAVGGIVKSAKKATQPLNVIIPQKTFDKETAQETYKNLKSNFVDLETPKDKDAPLSKNNVNKIKTLVNLQYKPLSQIKKDIPNFTSLFRGSKMVDEQGQPILLYRGVTNVSTRPVQSGIDIMNLRPSNFNKAYTTIGEAQKLKKTGEASEYGDAGTVFASNNITTALGYSQFEDNVNYFSPNSLNGVIPFYVNAKKIIEHQPKYDWTTGNKYNWATFDKETAQLKDGEVLVYKSDRMVDSPGMRQNTYEAVRKAKLETGKKIYDAEGKEPMMIVAFGPNVQIIPAMGKVPELDKVAETADLKRTRELNLPIIERWKKQSFDYFADKIKKAEAKKNPEVLLGDAPEFPKFPDTDYVDIDDVNYLRENKSPQTFFKDEPIVDFDRGSTKDETGRKIQPNFPEYNKGGTAMNRQMKMAFMQEGGEVERDPVSGNEVPIGSFPEEVRDDVPAMLSEGEYVVPADVLRFYGLKFFEDLRDKAKIALAKMEKDGRIGGEPMSPSIPDTPTIVNKGGVIKAQSGTMVGGAMTDEQIAAQEAAEAASVTTASGNTRYTAPIKPPSNAAFQAAVSSPISAQSGMGNTVKFINEQGMVMDILVDAKGMPLYGAPQGYVSMNTPKGKELAVKFGFSGEVAAGETDIKEAPKPATTNKKDKTLAEKIKEQKEREAAVEKAMKISASRLGLTSEKDLTRYKNLSFTQRLKLADLEIKGKDKFDAEDAARLESELNNPKSSEFGGVAGAVISSLLETIGIDLNREKRDPDDKDDGGRDRGDDDEFTPFDKPSVGDEADEGGRFDTVGGSNTTSGDSSSGPTVDASPGISGPPGRNYSSSTVDASPGISGPPGRNYSSPKTAEDITRDVHGGDLNKGALVTKRKRKPRAKRKSLGQKIK